MKHFERKIVVYKVHPNFENIQTVLFIGKIVF